MSDPIDLDELERVLASGPDLPLEWDPLSVAIVDGASQVVVYASDGFNDGPSIVISECDKAAVLAAVNACPALVAEVRALRAALTEACDKGSRGALWGSDIDRLRAIVAGRSTFWPSHLKFSHGQRVISADFLESNDKRGYRPDTFRWPSMEGTIIAYHDSHGVCYEVQHDGRVGHYDEDELRAIAEGRR